MSGILASTKNNMQVFKKARCLWNENSKFLDRFKVKTFFFLENIMILGRNREIRDRFKVKTFFLLVRLCLSGIPPIQIWQT